MDREPDVERQKGNIKKNTNIGYRRLAVTLRNYEFYLFSLFTCFVGFTQTAVFFDTKLTSAIAAGCISVRYKLKFCM